MLIVNEKYYSRKYKYNICFIRVLEGRKPCRKVKVDELNEKHRDPKEIHNQQTIFLVEMTFSKNQGLKPCPI